MIMQLLDAIGFCPIGRSKPPEPLRCGCIGANMPLKGPLSQPWKLKHIGLLGFRLGWPTRGTPEAEFPKIVGEIAGGTAGENRSAGRSAAG